MGMGTRAQRVETREVHWRDAAGKQVKTLVGILRRSKEKGLTAPQIFRLVDCFNSKYGTDVPIVRPQVADAFLKNRFLHGISEDIFVTNAAVAYPGKYSSSGLVRDMHVSDEGHSLSFYVPKSCLGEYFALVATQVSFVDMQINGNETSLFYTLQELSAFRGFPVESGPLSLNRGTVEREGDQGTLDAYAGLGGSFGHRDRRSIEISSSSNVAFVSRIMGGGVINQQKILLNLPPSHKYNCIVVELPQMDVDKFSEEFPSFEP